jgi:WD40 repeat protein
VHEGEIYRIEVCKVDKRWLASSGDTQNICIWDIIRQKSNVEFFRPREKYTTDKCDIMLIGLEQNPLYAMRWSHDNYSIIAGGNGGNIAVWEMEEHN